jgi:hypothetical protein
MAFAKIHYFSRSLRKASSFNIVFPEDPAAPRPWAAFYLLHGLSDDHTIWARRTSIERWRMTAWSICPSRYLARGCRLRPDHPTPLLPTSCPPTIVR